MSPVDIAIIVVVSIAVAAALAVIVYRKVKHKGCCDCGGDCGCCGGKCAQGCPHCQSLSAENPTEHKEPDDTATLE